MHPGSIPRTPLSDDEFDTVAELLEDHSPFDTDGLLGVLHAVAVAPGLIQPSLWLPVVLPSGPGDDEAGAQRFIHLLLRLYNEVIETINQGKAFLPEPDDVSACESFATGYAAGAELDPLWIGDADRWTFALFVAYLGGRVDLVPKEKLAKFEADPGLKADVRRDLGAIIAETQETFVKLRRAALSPPALVTTARVGRNEPCPCGSGKKYKRCCIDRTPALQ